MANAHETLIAWQSIPGLVSGLVGRSRATLDLRPEDGSMSVRETVHHIVEANVVAASIVIAALGSPGCVYDWSWMLPFGPWLDRLDYANKPIEPAMALLDALNAYVAAQIEPLADGIERTVQLVDEPGAAPRITTVGDVLMQEVRHARDHVAGPLPSA